jgi:ketosteroid isomerase-like protein
MAATNQEPRMEKNMITPKNDVEGIALDFLRMLDEDDFEGLRNLLTEDAEWATQSNVLLAAKFVGNDRIVEELLKPYSALFAELPVNTIVSVASSDSLVLMESHSHGVLKDGRSYDNLYAWAIEVRDGHVAVVREYLDSAYVVQMLGDVYSEHIS